LVLSLRWEGRGATEKRKERGKKTLTFKKPCSTGTDKGKSTTTRWCALHQEDCTSLYSIGPQEGARTSKRKERGGDGGWGGAEATEGETTQKPRVLGLGKSQVGERDQHMSNVRPAPAGLEGHAQKLDQFLVTKKEQKKKVTWKIL